jgi:hypothetical protein
MYGVENEKKPVSCLRRLETLMSFRDTGLDGVNSNSYPLLCFALTQAQHYVSNVMPCQFPS